MMAKAESSQGERGDSHEGLKLGDKPPLDIIQAFPIEGKTVNLCSKITNYSLFGCLLLKDSDGSEVHAIEVHRHYAVSTINADIIIKWLNGYGENQPPSWEKLINVIETCDYKELARKMKGCFLPEEVKLSEPLSGSMDQDSLDPPSKRAKLDYDHYEWKDLYTQHKEKKYSRVESCVTEIEENDNNVLSGLGRFVAKEFPSVKGSQLGLSLGVAKQVLMSTDVRTPELCAAVVLISRDVTEVLSVLTTLIEKFGKESAVDLFYCLATLFLAFSNSYHNLSPRFHFYIYHSIRSWEEPTRDVRNPVPTAEQLEVISYDFKEGQTLKLEACAGSGKTYTLIKFAERHTDLNILYCCFNRSMKEEAKRLFPEHVVVRSHHSLIFKMQEMTNDHLCENFTTGYVQEQLGKCGHDSKSCKSIPVFAQSVHKTLKVFMDSADGEIKEEHIPSKCYEKDGVLEWSMMMWEKMQDRSIKIPHEGYTKEFQLKRGTLDYKCILIDDAEDLTPAQLAIYESQEQCFKLYTGDSNQGINGFRNAICDLKKVETSTTLKLTQSFRFGPEIAYMASFPLEELKFKHVMIGNLTNRGAVCPCGQVAFIARINKTLFMKMVELSKQLTSDFSKDKFGFPGGDELGDIVDIYWLKKGCRDKISRCSDLNRYESYDELEEYVKKSPGCKYKWKLEVCKKYEDELPGLVTGIQERMEEDCKNAKYVFATVHKAKGLQFDTVYLLDFSPGDLKLEHQLKTARRHHDYSQVMKCLYVGITRAKRHVVMSSGLLKLMKEKNEPFIYVCSEVREGGCCLCGKDCLLYFEKAPIKLSDDCSETSSGGVCSDCLGNEFCYKQFGNK